MQPKKYSTPKIALLNVELELKAEKENAEIRVDNVEVSYLKLVYVNDKYPFRSAVRNSLSFFAQSSVKILATQRLFH